MPAEINDMPHRKKVERLIADLGKKGVSPYTVAPPIFRLLWALGLEVPPPFFLGFLTLTLVAGVFFGIFWGAFMWLLQWQAWQMPLGAAALVAASAGLVFGLSMAAYYRWKASRLRLPPWDSYPAETT